MSPFDQNQMISAHQRMNGNKGRTGIYLMYIFTVIGVLQKETVCEGQTRSITCNTTGYVLKIHYANYGGPTPLSCGGSQAPASCIYSQSTAVVKADCENKQSCTLSADNGKFADRCSGVKKALEVNYYCDDGKYN